MPHSAWSCLMLAAILSLGGGCSFPSSARGEPSDSANEANAEAPKKGANERSIPDETALADAEKKMRGVFEEEFRAAKTPAKQRALASQLMTTAVESRDDKPAAFVLLRASGNLATSASDVETAWRAWDLLSGSYDVDSLQLSLDSLLKVTSAATQPGQYESLLQKHEQLIEKCIAAERYELLDGIAANAEKLAAISQQPKVIFAWKAKREELAALTADFAAVSRAKAMLATTPDDAGSNTELGRYLCFVKGDWDTGLKHLMKGDDETLRSLAERESKRTAEKGANLALGDGWSEVANSLSGKMQTTCLAHAKAHYEQAISLASGLDRAVAQKRLDELNKETARINTAVVVEVSREPEPTKVKSPLVGTYIIHYENNVRREYVFDRDGTVTFTGNDTVVNAIGPIPRTTGAPKARVHWHREGDGFIGMVYWDQHEKFEVISVDKEGRPRFALYGLEHRVTASGEKIK